MDQSNSNVLFLANHVETNTWLAEELTHRGFTIHTYDQLSEGLRSFDQTSYLLMIIDSNICNDHTFDQLEVFRLSWPSIPIVFLTQGNDPLDHSQLKGPFALVEKTGAGGNMLDKLIDILSFFTNKARGPALNTTVAEDFSDIGFFERRIQSLLKALENLNTHDHSDDIYDLVLNELAKITSARGGSLFVFSKGNLTLKSTLDRDHVPDSIELPLKPRSPFGTAANQAKPLLIKDIRGNQSLAHSGWQGYNDGSLMILPLMDAKLNILSLVSLHNKVDPPFNERDLQLARLYASIASNLLSNSDRLQEPPDPDAISTASIGLVLFDIEGKIYETNDAFAAYLGHQVDSLKHQNYWFLTTTTYRVPEKTLLYELRSVNRPSLFFEKEFLHSDGYKLLVRLRYSLFKTKNGPARYLASVESAPD
jgi:PAS domain S-box-containing protein